MQRRYIGKRKWHFWLLMQLNALLLMGAMSHGATQHYGMDAQAIAWELRTSIFGCELAHSLENFGEVQFYHRAGEDIVLLFKSVRQLMKPGDAALHIEPPLWLPHAYSHFLGYVRVPEPKEEKPIEVDSDRANQLMMSLLRGLQPTLTRRAYFDAQQSIRVMINPAQFHHFYPNYLKCVQQLLPVNFDQVKKTRIFYDSGQERLSQKDKEWLAKVALYVNNDPKVQAIYIDGHSDNVGRRYHNRRLSESRANKANQFLLAKGINPDLITTRYHGDRYPIASNRSNAGRAKNRRVTIRLEREDVEFEHEATDGPKSSAGGDQGLVPQLKPFIESNSEASSVTELPPVLKPIEAVPIQPLSTASPTQGTATQNAVPEQPSKVPVQ